MTTLPTKSAPVTRKCKPVELMFKPRTESPYAIPSSPGLTASQPSPEDYDLATVAGVEMFAKDVKLYLGDIDAFETKVEVFADECETAIDEAEGPELFLTFTNEDVHREIELAGFLPGDEAVMLLRGEYDRLVAEAGRESACIFSSYDPLRPHENGLCIHSGCGLRKGAASND